MTKSLTKSIINFIIFIIIICVLLVTAFRLTVNILLPVRYTEAIDQLSETYGLDPYLIMAVIKTESNFEQDAVSPKGAKGLMQLMDATAAYCAEKCGLTDYTPEDLFVPEKNLRMGCSYLAELIKTYSNTDVALSAYNAGGGNVNKWLNDTETSEDGKTLKSIPFKETSNYVKRVALYRRAYRMVYSAVF